MSMPLKHSHVPTGPCDQTPANPRHPWLLFSSNLATPLVRLPTSPQDPYTPESPPRSPTWTIPPNRDPVPLVTSSTLTVQVASPADGDMALLWELSSPTGRHLGSTQTPNPKPLTTQMSSHLPTARILGTAVHTQLRRLLSPHIPSPAPVLLFPPA